MPMEEFNRKEENIDIGAIISDASSPSTQEFKFIVKNGADVKKGQFVVTSSNVVGRVDEILKRNDYLSNERLVTGIIERGRDQFPLFEEEISVAVCEILGVIKDGKNMQRCVFPPSPGESVFYLADDVIFNILGLKENGLMLGNVLFHKVPLLLDPSNLLRKHLAILAMSGSGKSYTVGVLIEELLRREVEKGTLAVVVVDPHGEYTVYAEDEQFGLLTEVIKGEDIRFTLESMDKDLLKALLSGYKDSVIDKVWNRIVHVLTSFKEIGTPDLDDVKEAKLPDEKKPEVIEDAIERLKAYKLFEKVEEPKNWRNLKMGKLYVVDLSDIDFPIKRQAIVKMLSEKLFILRKSEQIPPFLLIIEEAHNFVPSKESKYNAVCRDSIEKIAREGRKFFACLCLVSQRPVYLSQTALSQCNTHIIMRITNPYDVDHIKKISEKITSQMASSITSLRQGECIIAGEAVNFPTFAKIREKMCKAVYHEMSLEEACKRWLEKEKKEIEDINAFL